MTQPAGGTVDQTDVDLHASNELQIVAAIGKIEATHE